MHIQKMWVRTAGPHFFTYTLTPCRYPLCLGLEHMAVRAEHREHAALGVIGELGAVAAVRLNIILVGANQPCHLVATIAGL